MMVKRIIAAAAAGLIVLGGCSENSIGISSNPGSMSVVETTSANGLGGDGEGRYEQISQEAAADLMKNDGVIILDVRTPEEYAEGHIPGAICIPNETIDTTMPEQLPDIDQTILVYCRSGRRSKEAAQKLADIGYTAIFEFGGIIDWTGAVVTDDEPTEKNAVTVDYDYNVNITEYDEKVIDDTEYSVNAIFTANETVTDFAISSLYMESIDDDGNPTYVTNELYRYGTLDAGKSLKLVVAFPGDMPNYQISYTDASGNEKKFTLGQSGRDGSLVLGDIQ